MNSEIIPDQPEVGKKGYHHGDLRNALIQAAVAAAREHGPAAVVVRDIARRVGVSHNAGYRHFASREELLTAVAEVGLAELADNMRRGLASTPRRRDPAAQSRLRLSTIGRAYVHFAISEPGLFRTIWGAVAFPASPSLSESSDPYHLLNDVLDEMVSTGAIPSSRRPYSEITAWSAVHGLATLVIDGPLALAPPEEVEKALDRLCEIIDAGL